MAQLTTVLPTSVLKEASGGITYSTTVYDGSTGLEMRNQVWATGRHAWSLVFRGRLSEVQPIIDLFGEAKGMAKSFLFSPPGYAQGDFRFSTDQLQVTYQASADPDDPLASVTLGVIQVFSE